MLTYEAARALAKAVGIPEPTAMNDSKTAHGTPKAGLTYAESGVDIEAGDHLVDLVKPMVKSTRRPGADGTIGGFGGMFDLKAAGYDDPILVSGTDGVGTKLRIAIETGHLSTVGIDLVAMCANDVLAQGAEPLFFLDYYACGKLDPEAAAEVVSGIAEGCRRAGCALIGGETAEMPGMYEGKDFDLAGFVVGAVNRNAVLPRQSEMIPGDVLIGIPSSGPHSNGYSLIRRVVERSGLSWEDDAPFGDGTLGERLLEPTRLYIQSVLPCLQAGLVKGLAHITGGGITDNVPRALPAHLAADVDYASWKRPALFQWLQETGGIDETEIRRAMNCGIGMVLVVSEGNATKVIDRLSQAGETPSVIGRLRDA